MHKDEKIQASWRCTKDLKEDLENFSRFSGRNESQIIAEALEHYFKSDKAFQRLQEEDKARRQFFKEMDEHYPYQTLMSGLIGKGRTD